MTASSTPFSHFGLAWIEKGQAAYMHMIRNAVQQVKKKASIANLGKLDLPTELINDH